jgi:hypothetical protein
MALHEGETLTLTPPRGVPLVQAPQPPVLGPHDVVPMPPILLKGNNKCSAHPILLTLAAVRHVWGLDMSGSRDLDEVPPAPIATCVVLQLKGKGPRKPRLLAGPFQAKLKFVAVVNDRGRGKTVSLSPRLSSPELQRAALGLKRVGLRRLEAGTVALFVTRPPGYQPPRPPPVRAARVEASACALGCVSSQCSA